MNEPTPAGYPIRAVAKLTGISIDALRVWERRYKCVIPTRTARGRLYDAAQVRHLMLLRDATKCGHSIGEVSKLNDEQLLELLETSRNSSPAPEPGTEPPAILRLVLEAIENYDYARADDELGSIAAQLPIAHLVYQVVHPLLDVIGKRWYAGSLTVAQEHMISALLRNLLGGLVRIHPHERRVRLLFATPAGELHEFGILCGAMLAVGAGAEAIYLGPNLPTHEIVGITNRLKPDALVLGVAAPQYIADLEGTLDFIAGLIPSSTALWIGGHAAYDAIAGGPPESITFLRDFESMSPPLAQLLAGGR